MLIGHERIREFFSQAIAQEKLSHAYCFVGPGSVGKRTVARFLAAQLLKINEEKLDQHPDFITLERKEDEKTGKLKKDIIIDQARDLRDRLGRTAWKGGYQVVLINETELLNAASANALLKLIEEPPKQSVFFLITENESLLLPTIRSRTQLFYFSLVPIATVAAGLEAAGLPSSEARLVAQLSLGRVGLAVALQDKEYRAAFQKEQQRYSEIAGQPVFKKMLQIDSLFKDIEEGERGREQLQALLDWWSLFTRDQLVTEAGQGQLASTPPSAVLSPVPLGELQARLDAITATKQLLRQNTNQRLAIEELILHF